MAVSGQHSKKAKAEAISSQDFSSKFTDHFCYILLAKASHKTIPDSRGGEINSPLSVLSTLKDLIRISMDR